MTHWHRIDIRKPDKIIVFRYDWRFWRWPVVVMNRLRYRKFYRLWRGRE